MIDYNKILEIASEIDGNDIIPKENLVITYTLSSDEHHKLDEHLFYKSNGNNPNVVFKHTDVIEVNIGVISFKFYKKD